MPNKIYSGLGFGLDLVNNSLDPQRNPTRSLDNLNIVTRTGGGFEKRKGNQVKESLNSKGGYGLFNYTFRNSDGTVSEEILSIGESLWKLSEGTLNVTNDGSSTARVSILPNATDIQMIIYEGDTVSSTQNLGRGYDEVSPTSLSSLSSTIDGLANFSSSLTGTSVSAAFLDLTNEIIISPGETVGIPFRYSEKVNEVLEAPLESYLAGQEGDSFENVSGTSHKNLFYFAFGGSLMKYDGQTFYKAGLPLGGTLNTYLDGPGTLSGEYTYGYTYIHVDNRGNIVESEMSLDSSVTASSNLVKVNVKSIKSDSGFSTGCGIASSTQSVASSGGVVTLSVGDGFGSPHTLKVGDSAYLLNGDSGEYETYDISAVTSSTITLDSDVTIGVTLGDVISNKLKIAIWRTVAGGSNKSLVAEIPNNSFVSSQDYEDQISDSSLGAEFIIPSRIQSPPPTCTYVTSYKDNLILGDGFTLSYSDEGNIFASSEVFPLSDNSLTIFSKKGGIISGLGVSGDTLTVFTDTSIWGIQGDLISDDFLLFKISDHIGCVSSSSIENVGESLYFLSIGGIFSTTNGRLSNIASNSTPISESLAINSIFENKNDFTLRRSVAINDPENSRYILFLPAEKTVNDKFATKESRCLVYEYDLNNWFIWSGVNMFGGAIISGNELWFQSRDKSKQENKNLFKRSNLDRPSDYWDHIDPIKSSYTSGWDTVLGNYSTPFKPLYLKILSYRSEDSDYEMDFTIDASIERDFINGLNFFDSSMSFAKNGSKFGFPWGSKWGSYKDSETRKKIRGIKVSNLRYKFENSQGGQNMVISSWELNFTNPFGDGGDINTNSKTFK